MPISRTRSSMAHASARPRRDPQICRTRTSPARHSRTRRCAARWSPSPIWPAPTSPAPISATRYSSGAFAAARWPDARRRSARRRCIASSRAPTSPPTSRTCIGSRRARRAGRRFPVTTWCAARPISRTSRAASTSRTPAQIRRDAERASTTRVRRSASASRNARRPDAACSCSRIGTRRPQRSRCATV